MPKGDIEGGGGRRQVTAVFIDLENFSAIASAADAEDLQSWLDDYYRQTRILIEASGGEVTEYLGDGVVAVFGLSRTEELSADRAVDAALRAVQSIRLNYQNRTTVRLRAGVATGEVAVRTGADRDGLPRLTGSVTTLAERIQGQAEPGTVLIAEETRALCRGRFETRALGPRPLKGFAEELPLYEVTGRLPAGGIDQPETFVGRAREMAKLIAAEGPVLIIGQAGVGKTAFVGHVASQFTAKSVFQGDAIGHGSSYLPFRDWLLDRIGNPNPDYATLAEAFPTLATQDRQALALILGVPEGQVLIATLSSLALKGLIEGALWRAILARQQRGLLLFEDLHWFDVASLDAINAIFASPEAAQFRIILTSREDAKLGRHLTGNGLLTLALDPLPEEDARVLLERLAPETLDPATRSEVLQRAGGVPLFLHQLARRGAGATALPATLMDLLGERIDSTGEAKPVLQRAAALGRSFRVEMLRALDGEDPLPHLRAAARAGVLVARPNNAWEFAHALLAQAAYQSMLRRTREGLHARIADMLQARFPQVLAREPGLLADHQHKARQILPAIVGYLQASQKLLMQGAFADAESMARAALGLCSELPGEQRPELQIAAHTMIGSVLMQVQGFTADPVRREFDTVLDLSSAQSILGPNTAPALLGAHTHAIISAQEARANRLGDLMDRMADALPDSPEAVESRIVALAARNGTRFYQGRFAEQLECIAAIRPLYRLEKHAGMIARYGMDMFAAAQMFEGPSRAILGQTDRIPDLVAETDAHQAALSIPVMQPYALVWGSVPLFYAGHLDQALARLDRGIAAAEAQGALFWQFIGKTWAQVMNPDLAKTAEGIAGFAQLIDTLRAIGANVGVPYFSAVHSARLLVAGRADEALAISSRALAETQAESLHCWYAEILRLHAANCRATGRAADAQTALDKAVEVATAQGAALWQVRALLDRIDQGGPATGLAEAVACFPSGAVLPDLVAARARLAVP
jgi:class 3 adenylate cyclase/tetratricopeptide (TPR) repeat protein